MKYLHPLPASLAAQAAQFEEFANGGAQCHAELHDGSKYGGLLISNATAVIAVRGHERLPFAIESIARLFQNEEDKRPIQRTGWHFFDSWSQQDHASL